MSHCALLVFLCAARPVVGVRHAFDATIFHSEQAAHEGLDPLFLGACILGCTCMCFCARACDALCLRAMAESPEPGGSGSVHGHVPSSEGPLTRTINDLIASTQSWHPGAGHKADTLAQQVLDDSLGQEPTTLRGLIAKAHGENWQSGGALRWMAARFWTTLAAVISLYVVCCVLFSQPHGGYGTECKGQTLVSAGGHQDIIPSRGLPVLLATATEGACRWEYRAVCSPGRTRQAGGLLSGAHSAYEVVTGRDDRVALERARVCGNTVSSRSAERIEHTGSKVSSLLGLTSFASVRFNLEAPGELVGAKATQINAKHASALTLSQVPDGLVVGPESLQGAGSPALASSALLETGASAEIPHTIEKIAEAQNHLAVVKEAAEKSEAEKEKCHGDLAGAKADAEKCGGDLADMTTKERGCQADLEKRSGDLTDMTAQEQACQADLKKCGKDLKGTQADLKKCNGDLSESTAKGQQCQTEFKKCGDALRDTRAEFKKCSGERRQCGKDLAAAQLKAGGCQADLETKSKRLDECDSNLKRMSSSLEAAQAELKEQRQKLGVGTWGVAVGAWKLQRDLWERTNGDRLLVDAPAWAKKDKDHWGEAKTLPSPPPGGCGENWRASLCCCAVVKGKAYQRSCVCASSAEECSAYRHHKPEHFEGETGPHGLAKGDWEPYAVVGDEPSPGQDADKTGWMVEWGGSGAMCRAEAIPEAMTHNAVPWTRIKEELSEVATSQIATSNLNLALRGPTGDKGNPSSFLVHKYDMAFPATELLASLKEDMEHEGGDNIRSVKRALTSDRKFVLTALNWEQYEVLKQLAPKRHQDPYFTTLAEYIEHIFYGITCGDDAIEAKLEAKGVEFYAPAEVEFLVAGAGEERANGKYVQAGAHSGRPRYQKIDDSNVIIEWSNERKVWRAFFNNPPLNIWRRTLYENPNDEAEVPELGWVVKEGRQPTPHVLSMKLLRSCKAPLWRATLLSEVMFGFKHEERAFAVTRNSDMVVHSILHELEVSYLCDIADVGVRVFDVLPVGDSPDRAKLFSQQIFRGGLASWTNFASIQALLHRDAVFLGTALPGSPLVMYSLQVSIFYVKDEAPLVNRHHDLQNCAESRLQDIGAGTKGSALVCFRINNPLMEKRFAEKVHRDATAVDFSAWGLAMEQLLRCLGNPSHPTCGKYNLGGLGESAGESAGERPCHLRPA